MKKEKLYLNKLLKVETKKEDQTAIVNYIGGWYEIAFFDVVANDQELRLCTRCANAWVKQNYPQAERGMLPQVETILLANKDEKVPHFTSCGTSTQVCDLTGRVRARECINEKGSRSEALQEGIVKNVYPAIRMSEEDFLRYNPDCKLNLYQFKDKDYD